MTLGNGSNKRQICRMILVTGATGLLGAALVYDLLQKGHEVRGFKRKESSHFIIDNWLKQGSVKGKLYWEEGDLLDIFSLENALQDVDTVYHCAGYVSFNPVHSEKMYRINAEGTANIVNLCLEKPLLKHFCHASSVSVLGRGTGLLTDENSDWIPGDHNSQYGISKYAAEREAWRGISEGLPASIVNPSIILGPGIPGKGSSAITDKIYKGFPFYTGGSTGFTDVRDIVNVIQLLSEKNLTGERFLLNGFNMTYKELFSRIAIEFGIKGPNIKVNPFLSRVVQKADYVKSKILNTEPFLTPETVRSAHSHYSYTSEKLEIQTGYKFYSPEETIRFIVKRYLEDNA